MADPSVPGLGRRVRRWADRVRGSSLVAKLIGAVVIALLVAVSTTVVLEDRLTRRALRDQTTRTLDGHLEVIRETLTERQSTLIAGLRDAAQQLSYHELPDRGSPAEIVSQLGPVQRTLGLDTIAVLVSDGRTLVTLGVDLPALPPEAVSRLDEGPAHHLVRVADGRYVQLSAVRIGGSAPSAVLVGGYLFDDAAAFRLRRVAGSDVLLVADGRLVGNTLRDPPSEPPVPGGGTDTPTTVRIAGSERYVRYAPMFVARGPAQVDGAVGLALPDPFAELDRALVRIRVLGLALVVLVIATLAWYGQRVLTRPLLRLAATARRVAAGDLDTSFDVPGGDDEVGVLARSLERMRSAVVHQLQVIDRQARDLRTASRRIVDAQDEERRRIANDLHDGLQRQLVVLGARVGLLRRLGPDDPDDELLDAIENDLESAVTSLRDTAQRIFPSILRDRGLDGGLHSLVSRVPLDAVLATEPDPLPRLDERVETHAFLFVSEALTNVVKHADAERVEVGVRLGDGELFVQVVDDGCGFDPGRTAEEGGLRHLRDRVQAVGGSLAVSTAPGQGTALRTRLPAGPGPPLPPGTGISPVNAGGSAAPRPPVG